jgi:hypothetical protein
MDSIENIMPISTSSANLCFIPFNGVLFTREKIASEKKYMGKKAIMSDHWF